MSIERGTKHRKENMYPTSPSSLVTTPNIGPTKMTPNNASRIGSHQAAWKKLQKNVVIAQRGGMTDSSAKRRRNLETSGDLLARSTIQSFVKL
jgi:hypothetical protein